MKTLWVTYTVKARSGSVAGALSKWVAPRDGEGDNKERQARQGRKVTDLCTWLQCYAMYMAVLGHQESHPGPNGLHVYDFYHQCKQGSRGPLMGPVAFQEQAALSGNKQWSVINPTLFSMNFTAWSLAVKRCELCFSTTHREDCDPDVGDSLARPAAPRSVGSSDMSRPI